MDDTKPFHDGLLVFSTSGSFVSINNVYQSGSQFSVTMTSRSKVNIQLVKLEFTDDTLIAFSSTNNGELLGGDGRIDLEESFGITLTLNTNRSPPILFRYFYLNPKLVMKKLCKLPSQTLVLTRI